MMDTTADMAAGTKKFKLRDFFKALGINGYPQMRRQMLVSEDDKITAACAFGQAALNLGISVNHAESVLPTRIIAYIITHNDTDGLTCEQIAELAMGDFEDELDKEYTAWLGNYQRYANYQGVKV